MTHTRVRKHTDEEYLSFDLYGPEDYPMSHNTFSLHASRGTHACTYRDHFITPGQRYRLERALVEGQWSSCKVCLDCIDEVMEAQP